MIRSIVFSVGVVAGVSGCQQQEPQLTGGKVLATWIEATRSDDVAERKRAIFKLGNAGPSEPTVLTAIVERLDDADARVRREAILALLKMGDVAQQAVPKLTDMQAKDPDRATREYAGKALKSLAAAKP